MQENIDITGVIEEYRAYYTDMQSKAEAALDRITVPALDNQAATVKICYPGAGVAPGLIPLLQKLHPHLHPQAEIIIYLIDTNEHALRCASKFFHEDKDSLPDDTPIRLLATVNDLRNPTLSDLGPFDIVYLEHPTVSNSLTFIPSHSGYLDMFTWLPSALKDNATIIAATYTPEEKQNLQRLLEKGCSLTNPQSDSSSNQFFTPHRYFMLKDFNIIWTTSARPKEILRTTLQSNYRLEKIVEGITMLINASFVGATEWFANSPPAFLRAVLLFSLATRSIMAPNDLSTRGWLTRLATVAFGAMVVMTNYIDLSSEAENPFELPFCPAHP